MMYLLQRADGLYVAMAGSAHSYTRDLRKARVFQNREYAERDRCGNETVVPLDSQIQQPE